MSVFSPQSYAEALEHAQKRPQKPRTALKRRKALSPVSAPNGTARLNSAPKGYIRATGRKASLKAKPDPELAEWGRRVRERDGDRCRWPGISYETMLTFDVGFIVDTRITKSPCATEDTRVDPHHINPRGRRKDLAYVISNGACLCRTHHNWCHDNPVEAEALGLLSSRTRELAAKENTLGVR